MLFGPGPEGGGGMPGTKVGTNQEMGSHVTPVRQTTLLRFLPKTSNPTTPIVKTN